MVKKKAKRFLIITGLCYLAYYFLYAWGFISLAPRGQLALPVAAVVTAVIIIRGGRWLKRRKYLNSPLSKIDRMSGEEFEVWLKYYFENKGYRAKLTSKSGDFGADLVLTGHGERAVVQAKRYKGRVGIEAIQQVIGAMAYYKATRAIVATNSHFTSAAISLAEKGNVTLMDREYFFKQKAEKGG